MDSRGPTNSAGWVARVTLSHLSCHISWKFFIYLSLHHPPSQPPTCPPIPSPSHPSFLVLSRILHPIPACLQHRWLAAPLQTPSLCRLHPSMSFAYGHI